MMMDEKNDFNDFNVFNKYLQELWRSCFDLQGIEHYEPAITMDRYQKLGLLLRPATINVGDRAQDMRLSYAISMRSGGGKDTFKRWTLEYAKWLGKKGRCSVITHLNPEQLIGKQILRDDEWIENRGYFNDDILILNDASMFFTSNSQLMEQIRNYFLSGLDEHPGNTVGKRLVDNLADEVISYDPDCVANFYLQEQQIPQQHLLQGILRRIPILHLTPPEWDEYRIMQSLDPSTPQASKDEIKKIVKTVKIVGGENVRWELSVETKRGLASRVQRITAWVEQVCGKVVADRMRMYFRNLLVKFCCIASAIHHIYLGREGAIPIEPHHVDTCYADLKVVVRSLTNHWNTFVLHQEVVLKDIHIDILAQLNWLRAVGKGSAYKGSDEFVKLASSKIRKSESTIRNAMRLLESEGYVGRCQQGRPTKDEPNGLIWITELGVERLRKSK